MSTIINRVEKVANYFSTALCDAVWLDNCATTMRTFVWLTLLSPTCHNVGRCVSYSLDLYRCYISFIISHNIIKIDTNAATASTITIWFMVFAKFLVLSDLVLPLPQCTTFIFFEFFSCKNLIVNFSLLVVSL